MGRYTLLLVLAAVAGGSYLSFNALRARTEAGDRRAGSQASVLARQLAESGQAIALTSITTPDGFENDGVFRSDRNYDGGVIRFADYIPIPTGSDQQRVEIKVQGIYGGATHRLASVYEFDPMDFPGPIWLDVPYASATIDHGATVAGTEYTYEPQIDPTKNAELDLGRDGFSFDGARAQFAGARSSGPSGRATVPDWSTSGQRRTGDLGDDVSTADDLYYQITNEVDTAEGDVVYATAQTVSTTRTMGAPDRITYVQGDLTVTSSGKVSGEGALVVEGDLVVRGRLTWDGLVLVRSEEEHLRVDLDGKKVDITGALVVSQEAYPPDGHIDLTVFRAPTGAWSSAWGRREAGPVAGLNASSWDLGQAYRWYDHTHRFDLPTDGDGDRLQGRARFYDRANAAHQAYTGLGELIASLGSTDIQVEFAHVANAHGHAVYDLEVAGEGSVQGVVKRGFAGTALEGATTHRSKTFQANDLRRLTVRPRSRRSLRKLWDGAGACPGGEWPYCVGEDRGGRRGALTVRIRRASDGAALYEGVLYWHRQQGAEVAEHEAELDAWRADVTSGARPFGTTLTMGPEVTVTYAGAPIVALADKLGFDGNEVIHISTESDLTEAIPTRAGQAAGADPSSSPGNPARDETPAPPITSPPDQDAPQCSSPLLPTQICNKPGRNGGWHDRTVPCNSVQNHLDHGCKVGSCSANGLDGAAAGDGEDSPAPPLITPTTSQPIPNDPTTVVKVCTRDAGPGSSWNEREMPFSRVTAFLQANPLARYGTCSDHGL